MGSSVSKSDAGFGPQLAGMFDFTLRFEDIFFTMVPAALAILAAAVYLKHVLRSSPEVAAGVLLWVKEVFAMALIAVQVANIAVWAQIAPETRTGVSLAAAALSCAEAVCVAFIVFAKHRYSHRQSTFLSLFLSITLLLEIGKAYSASSRPGMKTIFGLYIATIVIKFTLIALEEVPKVKLVKDEGQRSHIGKEGSAGFWNRSFFCWINPLLLVGFRRSLTVEDLSDLGPEFKSEELFQRFKLHWAKVVKSARFALARACFLTFCWAFLRIVVPRLAHIGFTFAQPFLLRRVIGEVGKGKIADNVVGGLIGATALIYLGICITRTHYQHYSYQLTTQLRGALTTAIYDKMLRLSQEELEKSAAVTLVSNDLANMERLISRFHDLWASFVEVGLSVYILATMIGPACVLILGPAGIFAFTSTMIANKMGAARVAWNEKIEFRVAKTSNLLAQLKSVKMTGLAPSMSSYIQTLRQAEVKTSLKERNLRVVLHSMNAVTVGLTPVAALAGAIFWTKKNEILTAAEIFAILAVVSIVADPLGVTLSAIPFIFNSFASLVRIQKFLCLDELSDSRRPLRNSAISPGDNGTHKQKSEEQHYMIKVSDVSIESTTSGTVFYDVQMEIHHGSVTMIFGPVGCGKTALLKTLLGEINTNSGSIEVTSADIGYCDQTDWICNATIRDNIIGRKIFDPILYARVVFACALDHDFAALSKGDQTLAGSEGSNLSGGQKQRVALARAMYALPSMMVLDDVLSAVDKETTSLIMSRLLGETGILRSLKTTVIMTTNTLHHLLMADTIYTFSEDGKVHQISYEDETELAEGAQQSDVSSKDEDDKDEAEEKEESDPPAVQPTKEEDDQRLKGDFTLYIYYLSSAGALILILFAIAVSLAALSERLPQIYVRIWYQNDPSNKLYFIGFGVLALSSVFFAAVCTMFYYRTIVANTSVTLHERLLHAVMVATLKFISDTDAGSILNRFSQDMSLIAQDLPQQFQEVSYMLFSILADIAILSSASKYTAAIIPFFIFVVYGIQYFYLRTSRQLRLLELEVRTPLYTLFSETATGIQHIRAFGWQEEFSREHVKRLDYSQKPYYYLFCIQRWLNLVLDMSTTVIAIVVVAFALNFAHITSESAVGLALLNLVTFSSNVSYLVQVWVLVEASLGAIARVRAFCWNTPQEPETEGTGSSEAEKHSAFQGRIKFDGVSASYNPEGVEDDKVLDDVSVVIEPGQKVGISGRSGSGKSSFLLAILNMLTYTGSIKIDNHELSTISRSHLRAQITTLTQDGIDLPGSVRFNANPFIDGEHKPNAVSDDDMITALTQVGLWERIAAHGGLDADMQKTRLSKGQKQLFSLARAMLRQKSTASRIVLVDEATSSLDVETERRVQEVMDEAFKDCTIITVSHRLHAFEKMDILLKVDGGKVVKVARDEGGGGSSEVAA